MTNEELVTRLRDNERYIAVLKAQLSCAREETMLAKKHSQFMFGLGTAVSAACFFMGTVLFVT